MGTLRYSGAPDLVYDDQVLANIQQIIAIQQKMGQGFWIERQGMDDKTIGHDAIWIDPSMHIYIEFDSIDQIAPQNSVIEEWRMTLTVLGGDRLVLHPDAETLERIKKVIDEDDGSEERPR